MDICKADEITMDDYLTTSTEEDKIVIKLNREELETIQYAMNVCCEVRPAMEVIPVGWLNKEITRFLENNKAEEMGEGK